MAEKAISAILAALLLASSALLPAGALPIPSGEADGFTREIHEGVYYTSMALEGSPYGRQKVNVVEFDLAQRDLSLEILKRDHITDKKTVPAFVSDYNAENAKSGKKVLAAINGDLWMTGVHSGPKVAKQVLKVPRGVLISEGVIYCSSQIPNESTYTTNGEGHAVFWAFGISEDYIPMIGVPLVSLTVKNASKGTQTVTEAFNRLPAHDSLVVYDGNCGVTNFALDDAYEVVLTDIAGEFRCGATVSGTVSAIFTPDDADNPTIDKNSLVLTARGTATDEIKGYALGDKVTIDVSVRDISGRDNDWSKAVTAIGGHMPLVLDGASTGGGDTTAYPCTIAGIKNDGKAIFVQNDGRQPKWSEGFRISDVDNFLLQLGVNSAIYLDGGGSSTMVVGEELVNKPSDGAPRAVINGIALVSRPERAPQAAFTTRLPYRFNARYLKFDTQDALDQLLRSYRNDTNATLEDGFIRLRPSKNTIDPYIYYDLSAAVNKLNANNYKYIVIKYRTSAKVTVPQTELFLCSGSIGGPTGGYSVVFDHGGELEQWNTQIVDLSEVDYWKGGIHGIRLDYFAGNSAPDEHFDLEYIAFAKSAEEAQSYADGTAEIPPVPPESTEMKAAPTGAFKVENGIVSGVKSGSTAYDVVRGLTGAKLEVRDKDGNCVRNQTVRTGYTVTSYDMALNEVQQLVIAVAGDINGDGCADNLDAAIALQYDASLTELDALQLRAGDLNGDGSADNLDAARILMIDAGLEEP